MVHGVEELVFVGEVAEEEEEETREEDLPGGAEDRVDHADDEDEEGGGEVEAVAEDGGLDELGVVWAEMLALGIVRDRRS